MGSLATTFQDSCVTRRRFFVFLFRWIEIDRAKFCEWERCLAAAPGDYEGVRIAMLC